MTSAPSLDIEWRATVFGSLVGAFGPPGNPREVVVWPALSMEGGSPDSDLCLVELPDGRCLSCAGGTAAAMDEAERLAAGMNKELDGPGVRVSVSSFERPPGKVLAELARQLARGGRPVPGVDFGPAPPEWLAMGSHVVVQWSVEMRPAPSDDAWAALAVRALASEYRFSTDSCWAVLAPGLPGTGLLHLYRPDRVADRPPADLRRVELRDEMLGRVLSRRMTGAA